MYERLAAVVAICLAFLFFWSPIFVTISALILSIIYYKYNYLRKKSNAENVSKKNRPKSNQMMTSDNRFGSNVRYIKTARRTLNFRSTSADNYPLSYLTEPMNAKYFQQSDSLLASTSGLSASSRPTSAAETSHSFGFRPPSVSPATQLGNMPFVKLSSAGSESFPPELKPKVSPVKPVTVRIAPMPQNFSKLTLNRLSNNTATTVPTMGANSITYESSTSMQTRAVVDALKKSLRRKREPKTDFEVEDNYIVSANKKPKREGTDLPITPNGSIPCKQSVKRQANELSSKETIKRFKNNEIFSSYSSSPQLSQGLTNKRKLSPESKQLNDVKIMKSLPKQPEVVPAMSFNKDVEFSDNALTFNFIEEKKPEQREPQFTTESAPKRSYGLPFHLYSMEDHERDRNKTKHRLNRFLTAVKEATSPKGEQPNARLTTTIEPVTTSEVETVEAAEVSQSQTSSEIGLPEVPAAAIFTNSRVETSVTTSLLNTPISSVSSVMTTNKESLSASSSPQMMSANTSLTSVTVTSESAMNSINPINTVITESQSSSANPLANWPSNPIFTAKPQLQPQPQSNMLFSVGAGSSTTRRIAQNSRLRTRQRR